MAEFDNLDVDTWANIQANIEMYHQFNLGQCDFFTMEEVKKNSKGETTTCQQYIDDMEKLYPGEKFWEKGNWCLPIGGRIECRKLDINHCDSDGYRSRSEIYVLEDDGVIVAFHWHCAEVYKLIMEDKKSQTKSRHCSNYDDDDNDWGAGSNSSSYGDNDTYSQAELDNHANQCNPNNDAYHSSRR